jgi:hypothetical protein
MAEVADTIVVKRLVRNLRYKLTYIMVFESFLLPEPHPAVTGLLRALISAEQTAIVPLARYLKGLGVATQDLTPNRRLLDHTSDRNDVRSRLRFIHYGLSKAVSWYKTQLMDKQMTADPELKKLLFELGEREAASLWRTEAVMVMLRIRRDSVPKDPRRPSRTETEQEDSRHLPLMDTLGRPAWTGRQPATWTRLSRASSDG